MELAWMSCVLIVCNIIATKGIDWNLCEATARRGDGLTCYKSHKMENSFENAQNLCERDNMKLVSIASAEENDAILRLMSSATIGEAWINLKQSVTTWRWPDGTELKDQGCYVNPDLDDSMALLASRPSNNNFYTCSQVCTGYKYVGLMNGIECLCGNKFGGGGQIGAQCQVACPSAANENCGGSNSQRILAVNGVYSNWLPDQPNDGGSTGEHQMCSIIDESFQWNDIDCNMRYLGVCEIALSPEYFPTCDVSKPGVKLMRTKDHEKCIYTTDTAMTYFETVNKCSLFNGTLLKIDSEETSQATQNILPGNVPFWIGATKFQQTWNTGEKVIFSSWKKLNFDRDAGCGFIKRDDQSSRTWNIDSCTASKFTICQATNATYSLLPTYFLTTTTTIAPSPATKLIGTPPSTTILTLPPNSFTTIPPQDGNQNKGNDVNASNKPALYGIIGGAIAGALLLITITAIVIVILCKRINAQPAKRDIEKEESVRPSYFFGIDLDDGTMTSKSSMSKSPLPDVTNQSDASSSPPPYGYY